MAVVPVARNITMTPSIPPSKEIDELVSSIISTINTISTINDSWVVDEVVDDVTDEEVDEQMKKDHYAIFQLVQELGLD